MSKTRGATALQIKPPVARELENAPATSRHERRLYSQARAKRTVKIEMCHCFSEPHTTISSSFYKNSLKANIKFLKFSCLKQQQIKLKKLTGFVLVGLVLPVA